MTENGLDSLGLKPTQRKGRFHPSAVLRCGSLSSALAQRFVSWILGEGTRSPMGPYGSWVSQDRSPKIQWSKESNVQGFPSHLHRSAAAEGGQDRFAFEYWYMGHKYVGSVLRAMLTMLQAGHVQWWAERNRGWLRNPVAVDRC